MHSEMMKLFEEAKVLLPKCLLYWYKSTCFTLHWYKSTWKEAPPIHPVLHACLSSGTFAHFAKHSHTGVALVTSNNSTEIASYLLVVHVLHLASQYLPDESRVVHLLSTSGDLTQKKIPGYRYSISSSFPSPPLSHTTTTIHCTAGVGLSNRSY
jgi:hypothetical protein